jgi:hypothetical protein
MQDVLENGRRTHASGFGYVALETFADGVLLNGQVVKTAEQVEADARRLKEAVRKAEWKHSDELLRQRRREARQRQESELQKLQRERAIPWVKQTIHALEAFLRGEQLQMRGRIATDGCWRDFDLAAEIDKGMISWRVKPKGETGK